MATIGSLTLTLDGQDAMKASIASLSACVSPELAQRLSELGFRDIVLGDDTDDLVLVEPVDGSAAGTFVLEPLKVSPGNRYLEFVSAIAEHGNAEISGYEHGWPILSSVCCSTTMADGAAESIRGTESPETKMRPPFEITSTGIVLRGDCQFSGDILVGEAGGRAHEFRPLSGGPLRPGRSFGGVAPVLTKPQRAMTLRIKTGEDCFLEIASTLAIALECNVAIEEQRAFNSESAAPVNKIAPPEDGVAVIRVIEKDLLVCEVRVCACHDSKSPVVVRTSTVADTGEAASFPGRGLA